MDRLTVMTPTGAALKMDDIYPNESAIRSDLMRRYRVAVDRLASYEDTGLMPDDITGLMAAHGTAIAALAQYRSLGTVKELRALIKSPPNAPLTMEELREMDGEPVWCVDGSGNKRWAIVSVYGEYPDDFECYTAQYGRIPGWGYGIDGAAGWLAYRRKPEEV